jgi:hypothetical protein
MSHFAKRHYEAIALMLQRVCPDLPMDREGFYDDEGYDHDALGRQLMWDDIRAELADTFKADNSQFNRDRFLFACKPGRNVRAKTAHLKAL